MAGIKINGDTSGSTTITAPDTGTDETIELSTALASKLDLAGGKILQIVRATDSTNRSTTSTSFVDVTGMSVTITPQKNDSAVLLIASFHARANVPSTNNSARAAYQITDNSNNSISGCESAEYGQSSAGLTNIQMENQLTLVAYATPATTSATTYKLRFRTVDAAATAGIRNGDRTGQMFAIEVSA